MQMMCVVNSPKLEALRERAQVQNSSSFDAQVRKHVTEHGTLPHLDEIRGADSTEAAKKQLGVDKYNLTKTSKVMKEFVVESIPELSGKVNNIYRDQEIKFISFGDKLLASFTKRPTKHSPVPKEKFKFGSIDNEIAFQDILEKLADHYNIKMNHVTTDELESDKFQNLIEDAKHVSAFIYDGEIYINSDVASIDAPLHELSHLLIGGLRTFSPKQYASMVSLAEQFPEYDVLIQKYKGRTRNDVNEEIFIEELGKYLTGQKSVLQELTDYQKYQIDYEIKRILDSIFMGSNSVKSIPNDILFNSNLKQIAEIVNSGLFAMGDVIQHTSQHRTLSNMKSELLKNKKLKEYC